VCLQAADSALGCAEAKDELVGIAAELPEHVPLLVWANKMDVEGSITETELSERLSLWMRPDCQHRQWCIQGSVVHDMGRGVDHGMKWLYLALSQKQPKKWSSAERHRVENENATESVTPTKPNAQPAVSAASDAEQSSPGRARLRSTAESIVEEGSEGEEDESSDDGSDEESTSGQLFAKSLFSTVPLLQHLDDAAREKLAEDVKTRAFAADVPIVVEGDMGDVMFFVEQGQANVVVAGEIVKQYARGDFFGELALSDANARRAATVLAGSEGARCILLGKAAFDSFSGGVADILEERQRTYAFARSTLSGTRNSSGQSEEPGEFSPL
jgi:hypothetical protein